MGAVGLVPLAPMDAMASVCRASRVHSVPVGRCCCLRRAGGTPLLCLMSSSLACNQRLAGAHNIVYSRSRLCPCLQPEKSGMHGDSHAVVMPSKGTVQTMQVCLYTCLLNINGMTSCSGPRVCQGVSKLILLAKWSIGVCPWQ